MVLDFESQKRFFTHREYIQADIEQKKYDDFRERQTCWPAILPLTASLPRETISGEKFSGFPNEKIPDLRFLVSPRNRFDWSGHACMD